MTAALSLRRFLAVCAAAFVAVLASSGSDAQAGNIRFVDANNLQYATSQVSFTCYGRNIHYRADTFVTAQYGSYDTPTAAFRTVYDVWNGTTWDYAGLAIDWTSASVGGQWSLNLASGQFFRLRTQMAYLSVSGWRYFDWQVETFNYNGLQFCRV